MRGYYTNPETGERYWVEDNYTPAGGGIPTTAPRPGEYDPRTQAFNWLSKDNLMLAGGVLLFVFLMRKR